MSEHDITDKSGRLIKEGDILQLRLGSHGVKGGPVTKRVIRYGKKVHIVNLSDVDAKYGGIELTQQIADSAVVIESAH